MCYNKIEPWEGMGNALIQIFHLRDGQMYITCSFFIDISSKHKIVFILSIKRGKARGTLLLQVLPGRVISDCPHYTMDQTKNQCLSGKLKKT